MRSTTERVPAAESARKSQPSQPSQSRRFRRDSSPIGRAKGYDKSQLSIHIPDLFPRHRLIADELVSVQIFPVHIHGGDLVVIVGGVVVNPLAYIATAGVEGDLIFLFLQTAQSPLLVYAAENVEELADGVQFIVRGQRMELCKSHAHKS